MRIFYVTAVDTVGTLVLRAKIREVNVQTNQWVGEARVCDVDEVVARIASGHRVLPLFDGNVQAVGPELEVVDVQGFRTIDISGAPLDGRKILDLPRL